MPAMVRESDFVSADDQAPLDVQAALAQTPPAVELRGMFFNTYLEAAKKRGLTLKTTRSYSAFKMYPLREWQAFLLDALPVLHPGLTVRGALRSAGRVAYPTFADSMLGRVIFGVLNKDLGRILRIAGKGYEHSLSMGKAEQVDGGDDWAQIHLTDVWSFVDSYQVGVIEGAIDACGRQGEVRVRPIGPSEAEFLVRWR
jgi:uncharacterized protein (TIGR02265 family)